MTIITRAAGRVTPRYLELREAGPAITTADMTSLMDYRPRSTKLAMAVRLAFERPGDRFRGLIPVPGGWASIA